MSSEQPGSTLTNTNDATTGRGRGQGRGRGTGGAAPRRGRGGIGKYLRARGRGHRGGGKPAVFQQRLLLEGEGEEGLDPNSEEAKELARKYGKRKLSSNIDRYTEPEPTLNSDGELEEEPEVDLSKFFARQRLGDDGEAPSLSKDDDEDDEDEDEIDTSLAHLAPKPPGASKKGHKQEIEWNEDLERMRLEKETADAHRDLKERFRANMDKQKHRQPRVSQSTRTTKERTKEIVIEALPLPAGTLQPKSEKENMEDYLDDLLG